MKTFRCLGVLVSGLIMFQLAACGSGAPEQKAPATMKATFDLTVGGFGWEAETIAQLPKLIDPSEQLKIIVDGKALDVDATPWVEQIRAGQTRFSVEAHGDGGARALGELELSITESPVCEDVPPSEMQSSVDSMLNGASCTNNAYYWRCIDCQCRQDIYVKGWARRYICIYGSLYPQNVYSCICGFTPNICNINI